MGKRTASLLFLVLITVIGVSLIGCAGAPTAAPGPARTMPEMLTEAGFKAYPAETRQEMSYLQTCPKNSLMIHQQAGKVVYCFADPTSKVMYMGDEAAYRRLETLLDKQQQKIQEQRIESDPQFWNTWGHRWGGG